MKTKSRLCISRIYYWEKIYVLIPTRKSRGHIKEDLGKQTTEQPRSSMYGVCGTQYDMHWRYLFTACILDGCSPHAHFWGASSAFCLQLFWVFGPYFWFAELWRHLSSSTRAAIVHVKVLFLLLYCFGAVG